MITLIEAVEVPNQPVSGKISTSLVQLDIASQPVVDDTPIILDSRDVTGLSEDDKQGQIDDLSSNYPDATLRIHHCGHDTIPPQPCWVEEL